MPGGMGGGMGGLAGMLLGGGGGMGGGMRGMGGMGGMNQTQASTASATSASDQYDVDRWQRADGLDATEATMVQTVRADWDAQKARQEEKNPFKRLASKFKKNKKDEKSPAGEKHRPGGGTVVTPEMKKALRTHTEPAVQSPVAAVVPGTATESKGRNYLGLDTPSTLNCFFTANPINSAYLAVDSLGLGTLSLNQVAKPRSEFPVIPTKAAVTSPAVPTGSVPSADPAHTPGPNGRQNFITQRSETHYMDEFHQSREQQKYQVRIT